MSIKALIPKHKLAKTGAVCVLCLLLVYLFPLFHIKSIEEVKEQSQKNIFDAKAFVDEFWKSTLPSAIDKAVDAEVLSQAVAQDVGDAAETYGRSLGLSNTSFFFVSGEATVVSKDEYELKLALADAALPGYAIEIGPVFSSALRDSTGLLKISSFANTQEFNDVAAQLNLRVEQDVFPLLEQEALAVGAKVRFAGGVELNAKMPAPDALFLIPVLVEPL